MHSPANQCFTTIVVGVNFVFRRVSVVSVTKLALLATCLTLTTGSLWPSRIGSPVDSQA